MDWTSTAVLSAALMAVVNIMDSHLISRRMTSVRAYWLLAGFSQLLYGLVIVSFFSFPAGIGLTTLLVAVAQGVVRAGAVSIVLYYLRKEEVSRVIPVVYSYPVFVAIMAVPLLGESLTYLQWLAVIIVVAGAMIVSAEKGIATAGGRLKKTTLLLFSASLLFAGADIATKYVLGYLSFWNVTAITSLCLAVYFLGISLRPAVWRQLAATERKGLTFTLFAFNAVIAPVAIILSLSAMQRGPVSLVSTIVGSRLVFVAIYSLILSRILPGFLVAFPSMRVFVLRLAVIVMIFGGIAIIYLT